MKTGSKAGARAGAAYLAAGCAALMLLAGCGRDEPRDGDLFMRAVPEGVAPLDAAPDLSDIRPVPDLQSDEKAVAMLCSVRGVESAETCACLARAAGTELRGRYLAYFTARMMGDAAEAARLQNGFTDEAQARMETGTARIVDQCGAGF